MKNRKVVKEEYVLVLDYLAHGYLNQSGGRNKPVVQGIGTKAFTLLELTPKKDVFLQPLDKVYIGNKEREKIHHIKGKLEYNKLSSTGKAELEHALKQIVLEQEERFVNFFNKAQPLNTRTHIIEMLPGVGKKHLQVLVEERRIKDFESFADIKNRVKMMPNPEKVVVKRILAELQGKEKHDLFVGR